MHVSIDNSSRNLKFLIYCDLLEKWVNFVFDKACLREFKSSKERLIPVPITVSQDRTLPFEVVCDASNMTLGVILGKWEEKILYPIYYARKALNPAQKIIL